MIGSVLMTLLLFGQAPHDLDCRGRFEVFARVEPARLYVGEEITLSLRVVALAPWKRGPERPPLADDASLLSQFRVRDLPDETASRFPEGITGPTGTAWEYSWKLTPLPEPQGSKTNEQKPDSTITLYPASIPEIGLILTRDDVPWPRLAREMVWIGPYPLTYRFVERENSNALANGLEMTTIWVWIGMVCWLGMTIVWMLVYETILSKRSYQSLKKQLLLDNSPDPFALRKMLHSFFCEKGLAIPAEPDGDSLGKATLLAGYPGHLANFSTELWNRLERAAFGPDGTIDLSSSRETRDKELAKGILDLASHKDWRFWKRRMLDRG